MLYCNEDVDPATPEIGMGIGIRTLRLRTHAGDITDVTDNELKEGFHVGSRVRSVRSHRRSLLFFSFVF
jgi:hypothetical protein